MTHPLMEAEALQRDAALQGFDWSEIDSLWPKLLEEVQELRQALDEGPERRAEELGDVLFMVVNIARHLGVDPAVALAGANGKFRRRYGHVMAQNSQLPALGDPQRVVQMEALWVQAKRMGL